MSSDSPYSMVIHGNRQNSASINSPLQLPNFRRTPRDEIWLLGKSESMEKKGKRKKALEGAKQRIRERHFSAKHVTLQCVRGRGELKNILKQESGVECLIEIRDHVCIISAGGK